MREEDRCARCGKRATGWAFIGRARYCHPDETQPTCYMLEQWEDADDQLAAIAAVRAWAADDCRTVSFQDVLAHFRMTEEDLSS